MKFVISVFFGLVLLIGVFFYSLKVLKNPANQQSPLTGNSSPVSLSNSPSTEKINISKGESPKIPFKISPGFTIHIFASNLGKSRDLQFSPGGTLLVSNPDSGEVIAMPDKNGDGVADSNKVVLTGLNHAHGLAFYNGKLYVVGVDQVARFNWDESNLTATKDRQLFSLPENNDHNLRTIIFDQNGKMLVSVGSTCNVCREDSNLSATILTADSDGNNLRVFAKGLRNAPFMQFNFKTQELWSTEMGRDNLGDNIPPDELDIIKDGQDYGWPNCYGKNIHDTSFDHNQYIQDPCASTQSPAFEIPAHSAPLGLTFINSPQFPSDWQGDLLVSYHGSWNRSTPIGYKVVHLKVNGGVISSSEDFLTGFLPDNAILGPVQANGRPVDLTFDSHGNLYLSDDKNGTVYIIQKQ